jgi:hypothetical protein
MYKGTFGSAEKYKMLEFLTEKIGLMDDKHKNYLSSVIQGFNLVVKKCKCIMDISLKRYVLDLIYDDYIRRIDEHMSSKCEEKVITYLKNYIHAKIKDAKQK